MKCKHCGNNMQIADDVNISCANCGNYIEPDFYPNSYIENYPKRAKYDMRDAYNIMIDSLFHHYEGGTLSEEQSMDAIRYIALKNNSTLSKTFNIKKLDISV